MLEILKYFKDKEKDMPHEIMLTGDGEIIDKFRDEPSGIIMLEQSAKYFPQYINKNYYRGADSDGGIAYEFWYSSFINDWWVNIYYAGHWNLRNVIKLVEPYTMSQAEGDEQYLIIEIINGMKKFNKRHNVDIYKADIEYLEMFLQESKTYMID